MRRHLSLLIAAVLLLTLIGGLATSPPSTANAQDNSAFLNYDTPLEDTIENRATKTYFFEGTAGDIVEFDLGSDVLNISSFILLTTPDSTVSVEPLVGRGRMWLLPANGQYTVTITADVESAAPVNTLTMIITLSRVEPIMVEPELNINLNLYSGLATPNAGTAFFYRSDVVQIEATAGDRFLLSSIFDRSPFTRQSIRPDAGLRPRIATLNDNNFELTFLEPTEAPFDAVQTQYTVDFIADHDSTYFFYYEYNDTLSAELSDSEIDALATLPITISYTLNAGGTDVTIDNTAFDDQLSDGAVIYLFDAVEGDILTISMTSEDFDTLITLNGPTGQQIAIDDDGGDGLNSLIDNLELKTTGSYIIQAGSYTPGANGDFNLSVTLNGEPAELIRDDDNVLIPFDPAGDTPSNNPEAGGDKDDSDTTGLGDALPDITASPDVEATEEPKVEDTDTDSRLPNCTISASSTVNLRGDPSTDNDPVGQLTAGNSTSGISQQLGRDGFTWLELESGNWLRADIIQFSVGCYQLPDSSLPPRTIESPSNRSVVPPDAELLTGGVGRSNGANQTPGEVQVEYFCRSRGFGITRDSNNWFCTAGNQRVYTIMPSDFDLICQQTYFNPNAFALQTGPQTEPSLRWQCYGIE